MQRYFEGTDAETISALVHNLIMDFVRSSLNDEPRPATLQAYDAVTVTQSRDLASECYKATPGKPFTCIYAGDYKNEDCRILTPDGLMFGKRHTFAFELDMSLCDKSATTGDKKGPTHSLVADRKIVGAVRDAFNKAYFYLQEQKLTLLSFDGDAARQHDPTAINPHLVLIEARTLNS